MNVVASGVVVRWEPSGFTVVGWHRHDRLIDSGASDDVYDRLTEEEMLECVSMHLLTYRPGDPCAECLGVQQLQLWGARSTGGPVTQQHPSGHGVSSGWTSAIDLAI